MYSLPQSYNQTSKCKRCISSNAYDSFPVKAYFYPDFYLMNDTKIAYEKIRPMEKDFAAGLGRGFV